MTGANTIAQTGIDAEVFRRIIENVPDIVLLFDDSLHCLYVNGKDEKMCGETVDRTPAGIWGDGEGSATVEQTLREVFKTGIAFTRDVEFTVNDSRVSYHASFVPLPGENMAALLLKNSTNERHAYEELQEKDTIYQQITENINEIFWISSPDWQKIIHISLAFEQVWGIPRGRVYENALVWLEAVHKDDRQALVNDVNNKIRGDMSRPELPEYRVVRSDGTVRWILARVFPVRDKQGRVYRISGIAEDITKRKEAEAKLRASEERQRSIVDAAPYGAHLYELKADGSLIFTGANRSADRILGVENSQFIGKTIEEAFPALTKTAIPDAYRRVALTGEGYEEEQFFYNAQGIRGVFDVHVLQTAPMNVAAFFRDITEKRTAEDALRKSEEVNHAIVEASPDAVLLVDLGGTVRLCNKQAAFLFGYQNTGELVGMKGSCLIAPGERDRLAAEGNEIINKGSVRERLYTGIRKDGTSFPVEMSGSAVMDNEGRPSGIASFLKDISGRTQVEDQVKRSFIRLRHASEEIIVTISKLVEMKDPYTAGHQLHVSQLAHEIAIEMGLPAERAEGIRVAGLLHDIGKLYVPTEILSKPSRLSAVEFDMIKVHPKAGYEILRNIEFPWPVAQIALQHQERLDGSGYPQGLAGDGILLETRIVSVADVVEAMTFHRPYRAEIGREKAFQEIQKNTGKKYDETAVAACLRVFREKAFAFRDRV